jgi:hypothetical protein
MGAVAPRRCRFDASAPQGPNFPTNEPSMNDGPSRPVAGPPRVNAAGTLTGRNIEPAAIRHQPGRAF